MLKDRERRNWKSEGFVILITISTGQEAFIQIPQGLKDQSATVLWDKRKTGLGVMESFRIDIYPIPSRLLSVSIIAFCLLDLEMDIIVSAARV